MKAPIKIDEPTEDLFEQVDEVQELTISVGSLYSNPKIFMIVESLILSAAVYSKDYRIWEAKSQMEKRGSTF